MASASGQKRRCADANGARPPLTQCIGHDLFSGLGACVSASAFALWFALAAVAGPFATAQEAFEGVEEVVVSVGTRRQARSAADSVAPVDAVGSDDFTDHATSDISDIIRMLVPAYNVNTQPISDGGTIVRPANLRGLSPDQTLVLLNGKRRHRAAVITFLGGGLADGAQGPDVGVFPAIGLKQVEVLRDGAASQYGSDAIAGVINFVLRDDPEGGALEVKAGSTYTGDGDNYQVAGNIGLPLGAGGFVNLSVEYGETDGTIRSVQRADAASLIGAGYTEVTDIRVNGITRKVTQIWGQPEILDSVKFFANSAYEFGAAAELYAFGNYAERTVDGGFFFRNPTRRPGIFEGPRVNPANGNPVAVGADDVARDALTGAIVAEPAASVRVGDLTGNDRGDCPAGIPLTAAGGLLPDAGILASVQADDNCFSFIERFPGGFVPRFGGDSTDVGVVVGLRGLLNIGTGLFYDVSYSYGYNEIDYYIRNTVNASLGPASPTAFDPGAYEQIDTNFNMDFSYELPIAALHQDLHIAAGFERREERFDVSAGEPASYALGPLTRPSPAFPGGQGFSSSSNGFGGFTASTSNTEDNIAAYVDVEAELTANVTVQGALRWEDYSHFGSTTNYKLGALWRAGERLTLRGTYSTGFRAPTAGQANVTNVTTAFAGNVITDEGTLPLSSAAGRFVNAELGGRFSLHAEEARNLSIGASFWIGDIDITLDYFNIEVEDRIAISEQQDFRGLLVAAGLRNGLSLADMEVTADANGDGAIDAADAETSRVLNTLNSAGVLNAADFAGSEDLSTVGFFTNDFDTKTQGLDLVASWRLEHDTGVTDLALALNYTDTEVTRVGGLAPTRRRQLEETIPKWKGHVSARHQRGDWRFLTRLNFHGDYAEAHLDDPLRWIEPSGEITLDVEAGYSISDRWEVMAGAANVFDDFPKQHRYATHAGSKYPTTAPFGLSGGQYYLKMRYGY